MKRAIPSIFAAVLAAGLAAAQGDATPSAKQLVARNLEARGGAAWDKVRTLELRGHFDAWSAPVAMTIQRSRPERYRFDHEIFGAPATFAADGTVAWMIAPAFGAEQPVRLEDGWKRNLVEDGGFVSRLQHLASAGAPMEVLGRVEVEGEAAWELRVAPEGAPPETWYLDVASGLELKRESTTFDVFSGAIEMPMETFYMDFRAVEGLRIPFREERHFGTRYHVFVISEVRVNPEIDPARLAAPPPTPPAEAVPGG